MMRTVEDSRKPVSESAGYHKCMENVYARMAEFAASRNRKEDVEERKRYFREYMKLGDSRTRKEDRRKFSAFLKENRQEIIASIPVAGIDGEVWRVNVRTRDIRAVIKIFNLNRGIAEVREMQSGKLWIYFD